MSKKMYRQGGWLASFVVVATVLVLALLGTVYYLKTRQHQTQNVATTDTSQKSSSSSSDSQDSSKASNDLNAAQPQTADTNADNNTKKTKSDTQSSASTPKDDNSAAQTDALPTTGPTDTLVSSAIVTMLAFSVASYLKSRRYGRL